MGFSFFILSFQLLSYSVYQQHLSSFASISSLQSPSEKNSYESHSHLRVHKLPTSDDFPYEFKHLHEEEAVSIGFVVRAHAGYASEMLSLLWSLRSQERYDKDDVMVLLVVPTEPNCADFLASQVLLFSDAYVIQTSGNGGSHNRTGRRLQRNLAPPSSSDVRDDYKLSSSGLRSTFVVIMDPSSDDFNAKSHVLRELCTEEWRNARLRGNWPASALDRYCAINTPVHYHLTDMGMLQLLHLVPRLQHIVVTNADNIYTPRFSTVTLSSMATTGYDIVLVDMVHLSQHVTVEPELGKMDLGCAVIRVAALRQSESHEMVLFSTSIPSPPSPENWHDADFWFIDTLVKKNGAKLRVVHEALFIHN